MPLPVKLEISEETVKQDIANTIAVLQALANVIPGKIDAALVACLEYIQSNEYLLSLLVRALNKI